MNSLLGFEREPSSSSAFRNGAPSSRAWGFGNLHHQSLTPRPLTLDWITPPAFLVLQLADGQVWDFTSTTAWANPYNQSPVESVCLSVLPISWVSLRSPDYYKALGMPKCGLSATVIYKCGLEPALPITWALVKNAYSLPSLRSTESKTHVGPEICVLTSPPVILESINHVERFSLYNRISW